MGVFRVATAALCAVVVGLAGFCDSSRTGYVVRTMPERLERLQSRDSILKPLSIGLFDSDSVPDLAKRSLSDVSLARGLDGDQQLGLERLGATASYRSHNARDEVWPAGGKRNQQYEYMLMRKGRSSHQPV